MKVVVLGASGIIGAHMRLCVPPGITAVFYRRAADPHDPQVLAFDASHDSITDLLARESPDVVVNLVGESRVDHVERAMDMHAPDYDAREANRIFHLNVAFPGHLAELCFDHNIKYVHVSSQSVYNGENPPYGPFSPVAAVNEYGSQKIRAEVLVLKYRTTVLVRPSFVLGVRPFPHVGRKNPLEGMLDGTEMQQVADRWFSPLFAEDAARGMWIAALDGEHADVVYLGVPEPWSRFEIAEEVGAGFVPVSHDSFPGIADRPKNTTYATSWPSVNVPERIADFVNGDREDHDVFDRVRELALFFGMREDAARDRFDSGFGALHADVTADFRKCNAGANETALDAWYRSTEAYIWELSSYHCDARFNYSGMCKGIADRLLADKKQKVLVLGDGIGDMTLAFRNDGLDAFYHDLAGSRTAQFAAFRYWRKTGNELPRDMYGVTGGNYEAVCSADFLEHVTDVEVWVHGIFNVLKPGGLFFAQNAFACGSGESGEMPMHLACNDRYEKDWDPLLASLGFVQLSSNWYQKPE